MPDLTEDTIKDLLAMSNPGLRAALEAMLPKPTFPEHMMGLWATHPKYGEVVCIWDTPHRDGDMKVSWRNNESPVGSVVDYVPVSELTFPHQATEGELPTETEFNTLLWGTGGLTIHDKEDGQEVGIGRDELAQLGYAMLAYAGEPQPAPEFVETEEEYEALPKGAIVADDMGFPLIKRDMEAWYEPGSTRAYSNSNMSYSRRRVYRRGWGNE